MSLTNEQYQRLVGFSYNLTKDHSIKQDLIHDAWISYYLYSKNKLVGEELVKLLQFHIRQAKIKLFCKQNKDGKYVARPKVTPISQLPKVIIRLINNRSIEPLEPFKQEISEKRVNSTPYMFTAFKTKENRSKTQLRYRLKQKLKYG